MKPSNIQANQLDELIVAVKQVSDSIYNLGSDLRSIASSIEQADPHTEILTIAESLDYLAATKPDKEV